MSCALPCGVVVFWGFVLCYLPCFLKVGNLRMCMLTAAETAIMIICIGKSSCGDSRRFSRKTVEMMMVVHRTVRAVIFVLRGSPLPSL